MRLRSPRAERRALCAAVAGALLALPNSAAAAPSWVPATNFPLPSTDVFEAKPSTQDEIAYQDGGVANEAFLQVQSLTPLRTTLHVGTMPPGGSYADQLTIPSAEGAIPGGAQLAVAPDGAAVAAWAELTGPSAETSPYRYRAAYRPAGSAAWEAPITVATDSERNKEVNSSVIPAIGADGTVAVAVLHFAGEHGAGQGEAVSQLDVAVRPVSGAWAPTVKLNAAKVSAESAVITADAAGNITAAYQSRFSEGGSPSIENRRYQAIVRRRPASSGVWGPNEEITPAEFSHSVYALRLSQNEAGDAVLAMQYGEVGKTFNALAVTRQGPNGPWGLSIPLISVEGSSAPVAAGISPNGVAYVLYSFQGVSSGEDCVGLVRGNAGATWFTLHRCVSPTNEEPSSGSVAFIGEDAYVAWRATVPGESSNASVQGARWAYPNPLPEVASNLDPQGLKYGNPNLISDRQGSVVAFYTNSQPGVLRAAAYDGGPPILLAASVPANATVGQPVSFSASFTDLWSGLGSGQPFWSFGDGSAWVGGTSLTHTFAAAGSYTVDLSAIDALGNATSTTHTIVVSPPVVRPVISEARESVSRFRTGNKSAVLSRRRKAPIGTTFSFRLNERASVSFAFAERVSGRKFGRKCVAKGRMSRRHRRCHRTVTVGALSFVGHEGRNEVVFQGRISSSKRLKPGRYTLHVVATNATGERSAPATLRFSIVK